MAGETGAVGGAPFAPLPTAAPADAAVGVQTPVVQTPSDQAVATTALPQDSTSMQASGSAAPQATFVDPAAPPAQPGVADEDPPSPPNYKRPPTQVVDAFHQNFGRRVLPAQSGEALAGQILQTLGIDPQDQGAVKRLQRRVGAFPDGKFGPETWGKAIRYLNARVDNNDQSAQQAMTILLTPQASGAGLRAQRPVQPAVPVVPAATPAAAPAVAEPDPNAQVQADLEEKFTQASSDAMDQQLDNAWFWSSDTVAKNNITNPSSLAAMRPSTVAKSIGALISGWTSSEDQKAIMVALRTQANMGGGRLGQTFDAMKDSFKGLRDELTAEQQKELLSLAQTPDSGVNADHLKVLQSQ